MPIEHPPRCGKVIDPRFDSGASGGAATREQRGAEVGGKICGEEGKPHEADKGYGQEDRAHGESPHSRVIHLFPAQHRQTCRPCESGVGRTIDYPTFKSDSLR